MQYNISPETLLETRHPSVTVDKILGEEITFEMYKDNAVCQMVHNIERCKRISS